jgi:AraC-like DNA-binding protein
MIGWKLAKRLYFFDIFWMSHNMLSQNGNDVLDSLGFRLIPPCRPLSPYVRSYWHFRRPEPLHNQREVYVHPRGGFSIVFNLGDRLQLDGQSVSEPIFLDAANTVSRKFRFQGHVELVGIRFHEGGAYPFLGVPLNELRDQVTLLATLHKPGLLQLHARLLETALLPARIHLLEEWLLRRLVLDHERNPLIPASLALLQGSGGQMPVSELSEELAVSQRHLERLYQSQVGVSPKQFARLVRIERARLALKQLSDDSSTADVAVDLGFYDQSHFIRQFRAVVGVTPYAYMKRSQNRRNGDASDR